MPEPTKAEVDAFFQYCSEFVPDEPPSKFIMTGTKEELIARCKELGVDPPQELLEAE